MGLGLKTATQSAAEQAKRTMKQSELFIALRTFAPIDQKPILDYLRTSVEKERADEIKKTLARLKDGEAWFISPHWLGTEKRARFRLRETFDSARTPKVGETILAPKVLAPVDLARISAAIEAAAPLAHEPAPGSLGHYNDPDSALAAMGRRAASAERDWQAAIAERDVARAQRDKLASLIESLASGVRLIQTTSAAMLDGLDLEAAAVNAKNAEPNNRDAPTGPARANAPAAVATAAQRTSRPADGSGEPGSAPSFRAGAIRMLQACATFAKRGLTRSQLVALAKVKAGPTFSTYISELKRIGFVEDRSGRLFATAAGIAHLRGDVPKQPKTAKDIIDFWRGEFRAGLRACSTSSSQRIRNAFRATRSKRNRKSAKARRSQHT